MIRQAQPVSVLRKSGSSRCLQQDFKPNYGQEKEQNDNGKTVTLINSEPLPSFGTERYYMLSEIQMKCHSINFLCELVGTTSGGGSSYRNRHINDDDSDEKTQDMSISSHSLSNEHDDMIHNVLNDISNSERNVDQQGILQNPKHILPPSVILYLLWRPDCIYDTAASYSEHVIKPSIHHLMNLYQCPFDESNHYKRPLIYVVVDRVVIPDHMDQIEEEGNEDEVQFLLQNQIEVKKKIQLDVAEALIRKVSTDPELKLRSIVKGITVGLSDSVRAAPGLESCMDAIVVGDSERRRLAAKKKKYSISKVVSTDSTNDNVWTMDEPSRSSIGLITEYSDDLTGLDPTQETDAAQNDLNLHIRCSGVWEGNGNLTNFALLSQQIWRKYWNNTEGENSDDYLLTMYSIIMGTNGKKRNRRTGKKSRRMKSQDANSDDDKSLQIKYLPSISEQQSVEWAANIMLCIVIFIICYCNRSILAAWIDTIASQIEQIMNGQEL